MTRIMLWLLKLDPPTSNQSAYYKFIEQSYRIKTTIKDTVIQFLAPVYLFNQLSMLSVI